MNNKEKAKEIAKKCKTVTERAIKDGYNGETIWIKESDYDDCYKSALKMAKWKDEQAKQLHKIIIKLWDMLDWIDTYADLKINGSENDVYFSKIENKTKERFNFVKSDGYDLFINDKKITNNERTRNISKTD